jgi:ATP-dependent exoDNAse (exonuclease V) alpha subunit
MRASADSRCTTPRYASRGALHLTDTRDQAAENAVQAWLQLAREHPNIRDVALIADASNQEIDRLNARAQHLRLQHGELGQHETPLPHLHYGIREGDLITFTRQHRPPRQPRVENGTRGEITALHSNGGATIALDGSDRRIALAAEDLDSLRLAYAQHVYRQQGATVERSIILTGGWQTSKETAYVEATRARQRTDWYIARDDLGQDGQDPQRITRLADCMRNSRRQTPSLTYHEPRDFGWAPFDISCNRSPGSTKHQSATSPTAPSALNADRYELPIGQPPIRRAERAGRLLGFE